MLFLCKAEQTVPIQFDEVQCTGAEGSLGQCMFIAGDNDCDHSEDAGVICIGKCNDSDTGYGDI